MLKTNITITWSKIMALLVLISGTVLSFHLNSEGIFMTTISSVTLILGIKQVADTKAKKDETL